MASSKYIRPYVEYLPCFKVCTLFQSKHNYCDIHEILRVDTDIFDLSYDYVRLAC